ncbi:MAG: hypothetical protein U0350_34110 [Caldilineaceae bacterium]
MAPQTRSPRSRPPLRWTGIVFAFAANLLLVTVASTLIEKSALSVRVGLPILLFAGLVAGVLTALYVRQRGGLHAFIGGLLSVPVLALFVFQGVWPPAILAGAFCILGGVLMEMIGRRH